MLTRKAHTRFSEMGREQWEKQGNYLVRAKSIHSLSYLGGEKILNLSHF
jgi:hypothetical protein